MNYEPKTFTCFNCLKRFVADATSVMIPLHCPECEEKTKSTPMFRAHPTAEGYLVMSIDGRETTVKIMDGTMRTFPHIPVPPTMLDAAGISEWLRKCANQDFDLTVMPHSGDRLSDHPDVDALLRLAKVLPGGFPLISAICALNVELADLDGLVDEKCVEFLAAAGIVEIDGNLYLKPKD
jgi:hypothetical protein